MLNLQKIHVSGQIETIETGGTEKTFNVSEYSRLYRIYQAG